MPLASGLVLYLRHLEMDQLLTASISLTELPFLAAPDCELGQLPLGHYHPWHLRPRLLSTKGQQELAC